VDLPSTSSGTILVRVIDTDPNTAGHNSQDTVNIDQMHFSTAPLAPLVADGSASVAGGFYLTQAELETVSRQSIDFWRRQDTYLGSAYSSPISFEIVQMANPYLGLAYPGNNRIQIDVDAAGFGWSRNALFATLVHELGHLDGHDHDEMAAALAIESPVSGAMTLPLASWTTDPQHRDTGPLLSELRGFANRSAVREEGTKPPLRWRPVADSNDRAPKPSMREQESENVMIEGLFEETQDHWLDEPLVQLLAESRRGK
jgi:hypothetical protein